MSIRDLDLDNGVVVGEYSEHKINYNKIKDLLPQGKFLILERVEVAEKRESDEDFQDLGEDLVVCAKLNDIHSLNENNDSSIEFTIADGVGILFIQERNGEYIPNARKGFQLSLDHLESIVQFLKS